MRLHERVAKVVADPAMCDTPFSRRAQVEDEKSLSVQRRARAAVGGKLKAAVRYFASTSPRRARVDRYIEVGAAHHDIEIAGHPLDDLRQADRVLDLAPARSRTNVKAQPYYLPGIERVTLWQLPPTLSR